MKFYFCEKCDKRLTEVDVARGAAKDKRLRGVFCADCSAGILTMENLPLTEDQARAVLECKSDKQLPVAGRSPGSSRTISRAPRRDVRPKSAGGGSPMVLIGAGAGAAALIVLVVLFSGGSKAPAQSAANKPEKRGNLEVVQREAPGAAKSAPPPAVSAPKVQPPAVVPPPAAPVVREVPAEEVMVEAPEPPVPAPAAAVPDEPVQAAPVVKPAAPEVPAVAETNPAPAPAPVPAAAPAPAPAPVPVPAAAPAATGAKAEVIYRFDDENWAGHGTGTIERGVQGREGAVLRARRDLGQPWHKVYAQLWRLGDVKVYRKCALKFDYCVAAKTQVETRICGPGGALFTKQVALEGGGGWKTAELVLDGAYAGSNEAELAAGAAVSEIIFSINQGPEFPDMWLDNIRLERMP
ncbi:MAG: hypothetical protein HS116_28195 [Planctomycetes bacterium]|nr:hypothetical protein [Planctomycetota bacterium]